MQEWTPENIRIYMHIITCIEFKVQSIETDIYRGNLKKKIENDNVLTLTCLNGTWSSSTILTISVNMYFLVTK